MGWGNCGADSKGRQIGYYHAGTCDHPGCTEEIDRGLAHACGGMHGTDTLGGDDRIDWSACHPSCEGYFCDKHRKSAVFEHEDDTEVWSPEYCVTCCAALEANYEHDPEWRDIWPTTAPLVTASVDDRPEGQDAKQLGAQHASAVPKADAQPTVPQP